jgi:hypothetical protein
MKKILLSLTVVSSLLLANETQNLSQTIITKAMKSYQDKNYKVALEEFLKIKSFSDSAKVEAIMSLEIMNKL